LRIGNLGEPPSLDPHWGTQTITEVFTNHVFEVLHSLDEKYQPIPMLAEAMPTVSRDGLTHTIKLRKRGEALARACAAGATAASPGAQPSLPTAARLEEIVAR
jgi:peptide/nickel transport system substrate-binding protein